MSTEKPYDIDADLCAAEVRWQRWLRETEFLDGDFRKLQTAEILEFIAKFAPAIRSELTPLARATAIRLGKKEVFRRSRTFGGRLRHAWRILKFKK